MVFYLSNRKKFRQNNTQNNFKQSITRSALVKALMLPKHYKPKRKAVKISLSDVMASDSEISIGKQLGQPGRRMMVARLLYDNTV